MERGHTINSIQPKRINQPPSRPNKHLHPRPTPSHKREILTSLPATAERQNQTEMRV